MITAILGLALATASIEGQHPRAIEAADAPGSLIEASGAESAIAQTPCTFAPPSAEAKVIGFGINEGSDVSTVYVGDEDQVTSLINVTIEEGDGPLYLLLTSYDSVIWQIGGAVERVERVVASAYLGPEGADGRAIREYSYVGIAGLAADRVSVTSNYCLPELQYFRPRNSLRDRVIAIAQREPDAVVVSGLPMAVSLPSGTTTHPPFPDDAVIHVPDGFDEREWRDVIGTTVSGLASIAPDRVVSPANVGSYQVLPHRFGLSQLVAAGKLQRLDSGRFLVVGDIARIPAGLAGGHSAILVLADGVAMPPGDPAHGCVLRIEPGRDVSELSCPPPPPPVAVRTVPPPPPAVRVAPPPPVPPRNAILQTDVTARILASYPSRALRERIEGTVRYSAVIGPDGRVVSCMIAESSGSAVLDAATCEGMARYARFQPAIDNRGQPTSDRWAGTIEWRLPPQE